MEQYPNIKKLARILREEYEISASAMKNCLENNEHCLNLIFTQIFPVAEEPVINQKKS